MTDPGQELPPVVKTITQHQLDKYCEASGDHNPLHWDAEFAAGTRFGGVIAHGMLTMAFISEMMAASFGRAWLATGSLKVRFKGAAYVGDEVETWGKIAKEEHHGTSRRVTCSVGVHNRQTRSEIISGSATVDLPDGSAEGRPADQPARV